MRPVKWRTFETHHSPLGGSHTLTTVSHNLEFFHLYWYLAVNRVLCEMENGGKNIVSLQMAAIKEHYDIS